MNKILLAFSLNIILSNISLAKDNLNKEKLNIYVNHSFISGGLIDKIKPEFEKQCACELEFFDFNSANAILTRLQIEGNKTKADIALGFDYNLIPRSEENKLFQENKVDLSRLNLPITWQNKTYLPFDYGYLAFIYNSEKLKNPPTSFSELAKQKISIIIQDPRTSSPGLGFLLWNKSINKEKAADFWEKISSNIVTTPPSWTQAYGLFLNGEANMVLSYTTSAFYHQINDKTTKYKAAIFNEGHYLQVEMAAISKYTKNYNLANKFMKFILSEKFQKNIPESNWMYPVIETKNIPEAFKRIKPKAIDLIDFKTIEKQQQNWINEWLNSI